MSDDRDIVDALRAEARSLLSAEALLLTAAADEIERVRAERDAMRADAERYRYLTADLSGSARERRDVLLDRLAVMSCSAASAEIDAALAEGAAIAFPPAMPMSESHGDPRIDGRPCTCRPDDNPPQPCAQKYSLTECREAATQAGPYTTVDAWQAAIKLAHNICVQESDRINADDGSIEAMDALGNAARRMREWLEPGDQLPSLLAEATGRAEGAGEKQP